MYVPGHFLESRPDILHRFVERHPLATLVTSGAQGLTADRLPMLWQHDAGVLQGHMAKANPLWRNIEQTRAVLVIFDGPEHYISPNWYPSKHDDGRVVPTWNYATVQMRGLVRIIEDPLWLRALVDRLTLTHERSQNTPWQVTDAPADYFDRMLHAIVGVEVQVHQVEGKFKGSQNRSTADRQSVAAHLRAGGLDDETLRELIPGIL
ncbi:MAG TPA: FMN-binding negative transcriptional regulator [Steroidobacteraceae bacterium]|nr:FMN-binding negative transcriptional regulator [Steroidobacteraceae bacterium]